MQELIKIIDNGGQKAVSAKELYTFLGYDIKNWSRWCSKNISENEFAMEGADFQLLVIKKSDNLKGNFATDFAISIDFAKRLSMMARTQKGEELRDYFIACENKLKQLAPQTFSQALKLAYEQSLVIEQQDKLIAEQAPKVVFSDAIIGSKTSCLISELAKIITQNGYKIGQNRLFEWLRKNDYLGKHGVRRNMPHQRYQEQGLFQIKKGVHSGKDGELFNNSTTVVTTKGQSYFINKFLKQ